ncbi:MAG: CRISPR-associated endonuclease Cas2 [Sphaerochaeta sp.]
MRVIVMFDLPTLTSEQKREYRRFRKWLLEDGFVMMQMSIYSKIVLNENSAKLLTKRVDEVKAKEGVIQILVLTEKQFNNIEYVQGEDESEVINTMDRVVFL